MPRELDHDYVKWCRNMMELMSEGGVWGIPRSGLMFQRASNVLILVNVMPWMDGMPMTAEELTEYQVGDFESCRDRFAAAGFDVVDPKGLLIP